jgi:hypothetical protein
MRLGPVLRLKSFGSHGSTQALALAQDPRDLAPDAGLNQISPDTGPKHIGSWCRTQQNWVLTQDLKTIDSTSEAPKRIIVKIIVFILQIIIFFSINTLNYNKNNNIYNSNNYI